MTPPFVEVRTLGAFVCESVHIDLQMSHERSAYHGSDRSTLSKPTDHSSPRCLARFFYAGNPALGRVPRIIDLPQQ